ncbi:MAG: hypothetical protein JO325_02275, partial [Solirubrobacterales bacterium]|nr:hypothetical protein [Solirubrobacterales bacterium]
MPDGYERTAEDREEARLRRERGRGRGTGKATRRPAPPRRRTRRPSRARKYGGRLLALLALGVAAGAIWFLVQL